MKSVDVDDILDHHGYALQMRLDTPDANEYIVKHHQLGKIVRVSDYKLQSKSTRHRLNWRWLRHPNVVRLIEYFIYGNKIYFVFENYGFNEVGKYFSDHATPKGRQRELLCKKWTEQCLLAVKHANELGLFYENFSFFNVLIDDNMNAKIFSVDNLKYVKPKSMKNRCCKLCGVKTTYRQDAEKAEVWNIGVGLLELLLENNIENEDFQMRTAGELKAKKSSKIIIRNNVDNLTTRLSLSDLSLECQDFLISILAYKPQTRLTIQEALDHVWFKRDTYRDTYVMQPPSYPPSPQYSEVYQSEDRDSGEVSHYTPKPSHAYLKSSTSVREQPDGEYLDATTYTVTEPKVYPSQSSVKERLDAVSEDTVSSSKVPSSDKPLPDGTELVKSILSDMKSAESYPCYRKADVSAGQKSSSETTYYTAQTGLPDSKSATSPPERLEEDFAAPVGSTSVDNATVPSGSDIFRIASTTLLSVVYPAGSKSTTGSSDSLECLFTAVEFAPSSTTQLSVASPSISESAKSPPKRHREPLTAAVECTSATVQPCVSYPASSESVRGPLGGFDSERLAPSVEFASASTTRLSAVSPPISESAKSPPKIRSKRLTTAVESTSATVQPSVSSPSSSESVRGPLGGFDSERLAPSVEFASASTTRLSAVSSPISESAKSPPKIRSKRLTTAVESTSATVQPSVSPSRLSVADRYSLDSTTSPPKRCREPLAAAVEATPSATIQPNVADPSSSESVRVPSERFDIEHLAPAAASASTTRLSVVDPSSLDSITSPPGKMGEQLTAASNTARPSVGYPSTSESAISQSVIFDGEQLPAAFEFPSATRMSLLYTTNSEIVARPSERLDKVYLDQADEPLTSGPSQSTFAFPSSSESATSPLERTDGQQSDASVEFTIANVTQLSGDFPSSSATAAIPDETLDDGYLDVTDVSTTSTAPSNFAFPSSSNIQPETDEEHMDAADEFTVAQQELPPSKSSFETQEHFDPVGQHTVSTQTVNLSPDNSATSYFTTESINGIFAPSSESVTGPTDELEADESPVSTHEGQPPNDTPDPQALPYIDSSISNYFPAKSTSQVVASSSKSGTSIPDSLDEYSEDQLVSCTDSLPCDSGQFCCLPVGLGYSSETTYYNAHAHSSDSESDLGSLDDGLHLGPADRPAVATSQEHLPVPAEERRHTPEYGEISYLQHNSRLFWLYSVSDATLPLKSQSCGGVRLKEEPKVGGSLKHMKETVMEKISKLSDFLDHPEEPLVDSDGSDDEDQFVVREPEPVITKAKSQTRSKEDPDQTAVKSENKSSTFFLPIIHEEDEDRENSSTSPMLRQRGRGGGLNVVKRDDPLQHQSLESSTDSMPNLMLYFFLLLMIVILFNIFRHMF